MIVVLVDRIGETVRGLRIGRAFSLGARGAGEILVRLAATPASAARRPAR